MTEHPAAGLGEHDVDTIVAPVPVDQVPDEPRTAFDRITAAREGSKQPIVATWLGERDQRRQIVAWAIGYAGHVALFHLVRLPLYALKLAVRAPVGAVRVLRAIVDGLTDAEARPLRISAVERDDVKEYLQLAKERNARIRHRAVIAGVSVALLLVTWLVLEVIGSGVFLPAPPPGLPPATPPAWPGVVQWVLLVAAAAALGVVGRDQETPLVSKATTPAYLAPPLRQDAVETALRALPGMKRDAVLEYPAPIYKDGPGWLATVRLPHGYTVTKVLGYKEELAAGLRRPTGAVWPEADEDDASILKLWVGFRAMGKMPQQPWPLLRKGQGDYFRAQPYGTDNRARLIPIPLFEQNIVVGAIPGAGKSAAVRVIALGAALDPIVQLRLWSLKQNDLAALERISHTFGYGLTDDVVQACLEDLKDLKREIVRRTGVLSEQPKELRPDGKLTPQLAARRDLGLQPIVCVIDECQNLFSHEEYGAEAGKVALDVIRMGRAYGVTLILVTQRPDTNSLPKGVSANASIKICLRMSDHTAVDMVLGTGAHARGLKAELFKPSERGVGYVVGATDDDLVVRSFYLDAFAEEKIAERAHAMREHAGLITGHALGIEADAVEERAGRGFDLLDDVATVMVDQGLEWMWNVSAVGALQTLRPDVYDGLNEASLGQLLARRQVKTKPLNRKDPLDAPGSPRRNLTGFELADVRAVQGARQGTQGVER